MTEITGIDHIYVAVTDLARSEAFYDRLMAALGFRKNSFELDGERHVQYYNRHFGYVLRPAHTRAEHDPYRPGLHHFCFRVENEAEVKAAAKELAAADITTSKPRLYSEYAPDYVAIYFTDPDGIQLEITNYREERRRRHDQWDAGEPEQQAGK